MLLGPALGAARGLLRPSIAPLERSVANTKSAEKQNRQAQKDRLKNDLEFQVNVKAQTEIMSIARRLEHVEEILVAQQAAEG